MTMMTGGDPKGDFGYTDDDMAFPQRKNLSVSAEVS